MRRLLVLPLVLVLVLPGGGRALALSVVQTIAVGPQPFGVANAGGGLLYVANSGGTTVSIVDTVTNTVTGSITVGNGPGEIAIDPAAGRAYVGNFNDGTVSVIDTAARSLIATLSPGGLGVAVDPGLSRVYVTTTSRLTVFDTVTLQQVATVPAPAGTSWWSVAIDPLRHLGYLGDMAGHGVTVVDLATNMIMTTIDVGGPIRFALAMDPVRGRLFAATDTAPGRLSVINTVTNAVIRTVTVGDFPSHIAPVSASATYVTDIASDDLAIVDPATGVVRRVAVGPKPAGLAIVGSTTYVALNGASSVAILGNSAPVIDSVTITPASPRTNDTLAATVAARDADGDALTYAYQWTKNGSDIAGATALTLDLSAAGNGDRGDTIAFRVAVSDGTHTTVATAQPVFVADTAPVADTAVIAPAAARTNDVLTVSAIGHDADGDAVAFAYQWTRNGVDLAGATSKTLDLSAAGAGDRGDAIAVRVTPTDGTLAGASLTAAAVVIADSAPVLSVALDPASPTTQTVLLATASASDADGDSLLFTYVWKVNGVIRQTTTATTARTDRFDLGRPGNGNKGDAVSAEVTVSDGSLSAAASASTTIAGGHLH